MDFSEENILKLFGNEAAENEDIERLKGYYFKNVIYQQVVCEIPLRIIVGHKGIGKSALIKKALSEDEAANNIAFLIKPDEISGIANKDKNFLELIKDWKEGLLQAIADKSLESLELNTGSSHAIQAGKLLNFICQTTKEYLRTKGISLAPAKESLFKTFEKNKKIVVYIDDLDRGWEGKREDIKRISALLNAVRDLTSENPGLYFRIALRSDVYFLVRTSDESTDKIEGSVIWYSWTNHEILALLIKRIKTFSGVDIDENMLYRTNQHALAQSLEGIFETRFCGSGHWENAPIYKVLMSLIRKRPRDLVKLCVAAARKARQDSSKIITTVHLKSVFEDYSQGRIQDTINEYRTELPNIERLLFGMKPSKKELTTQMGYCYTTAKLLEKIKNIQQSDTFKFANGKTADEKQLAQFLYKINFLTARKKIPEKGGLIDRKYFEENRYLNSTFVDFGYDWEVHPAYRWALQPASVETIIAQMAMEQEG